MAVVARDCEIHDRPRLLAVHVDVRAARTAGDIHSTHLLASLVLMIASNGVLTRQFVVRGPSGFVFLLSDCVALYLYYCAVLLLSYYVVPFLS